MTLALAVAGCGRTSGPAKTAETFRLVCDPARLSLPAGGSGTLAATASDSAGNPIDGAHIRFSAADPRLVRVTALGQVTSLGPAGRTSISITSGAHSVTVPVDIFAGPARRFEEVEGSERAIVAGTPSERHVSVRLLDAFGNPVANSRVKFEAAIDPPFSQSADTDTNGVAAAKLPVITRAGHFILNLSTVGTPAVSLPLDIQVKAAAPAALEAVRMPPSGPVVLVANFNLVLRVRDAFGNPVPNVLVRWRTDSGSASFDPQKSLSGPDGLVRTRWQLAGLKRRRATLRALVESDEPIRFETWVALER